MIRKNKALGIIEIVIGGILSIAFGYLVVNSFILIYSGDDIAGIVMGIAFELLILSFFALAIIDGVQRLRLIRVCKHYLRFLGKEQSHSIDHLAELVNTPAPEVKKKLEKMIAKGYLAVAYIDEKTNRVICTAVK